MDVAYAARWTGFVIKVIEEGGKGYYAIANSTLYTPRHGRSDAKAGMGAPQLVQEVAEQLILLERTIALQDGGIALGDGDVELAEGAAEQGV